MAVGGSTAAEEAAKWPGVEAGLKRHLELLWLTALCSSFHALGHAFLTFALLCS